MGDNKTKSTGGIKAKLDMSRRFHQLTRKKHLHVAITAVARELCGFVWAILKAAPRYQGAV